MTDLADVVVVGGGPSGAAAASWLGRWGHHVVVVDRGRRRGPHGAPPSGSRAAPWAQAVSPRAVQRLIELGVDPLTRGWHRHRGLRLMVADRRVDILWSPEPETPRVSVGVHRDVLALALLARARDDGAEVIQGHEAVAPLVERGFVRGAVLRSPDGRLREVRGRYVVVADGAGSTFGRVLGTLRTTSWPSLTVVRSTWSSPRHDETWIESELAVVEPDGERLAAIVTMNPLGDGQVGVEVTVPSTARHAASLHIAGLLEHVVQRVGARWGLDLAGVRPPQRAERVPVGLSIRPQAGPTFVVIGTAVGAVNPFNGDGLAFGLESSRLAAEVMHHALDTADPTVLSSYASQLDQRLGGFFKLGRLALRQVGRPSTTEMVARASARLPGTTARVVRFMSGLADVETPADPTQRAALALARSLPEA